MASADMVYWLAPLVGLLHLCVSIPTALHALMHKDNHGTAIGWIGLVLLSPFVGSATYWLLGISRIKRKASRHFPAPQRRIDTGPPSCTDLNIPPHWQSVCRAGLAIHAAPYTAGNHVQPLINGDHAYPAMVGAIERAQTSVLLSSYIFDYDRAGRRFVDALGAARARGVQVRVLIDGFGIGHRWHRTDWALRKLGVKTAMFLPQSSLRGLRFFNLRNHRKLLCVDGTTGFIGGINIRAANLLADAPRHPVQDVHFQVQGPVIDQMNQVFKEDWHFATGELLTVPGWQSVSANGALARIIHDGPDQNIDKLRWTIVNAVNAARQQVRIATPYFMPDPLIIGSLQAAALRGVQVEIILPSKNNIPGFNWAVAANVATYLDYGLTLYQSPAPFDHGKLLLIDDCYSFIGSSNWDARSLELNFEINLECYDTGLSDTLHSLFDKKKQRASRIDSGAPPSRNTLQKLRNNLFRLLSPYL